MWVLVVGRESQVERPEGCAQLLRQLGCAVDTADLWELNDTTGSERKKPPATVVVEALDETHVGHAVLRRLAEIEHLACVPALLAVTVAGASQLEPSQPFQDFVLAPYVDVELYARIRMLQWRDSEFVSQEQIKIGSVVIDVASRDVQVEGRRVSLTHQEFELLKFLSENRGRVYSRSQLLKQVWDVEHYGGSRTVDIHVRRLRMKLGTQALPIETVRGSGYIMREP